MSDKTIRWGVPGHPREHAQWFRDEADKHGAINIDAEEQAEFMDLYAAEFDKLEESPVKLTKARRQRLLVALVAYIDYDTWKEVFQGVRTDDALTKLNEMDELLCKHLEGIDE